MKTVASSMRNPSDCPVPVLSNLCFLPEVAQFPVAVLTQNKEETFSVCICCSNKPRAVCRDRSLPGGREASRVTAHREHLPTGGTSLSPQRCLEWGGAVQPLLHILTSSLAAGGEFPCVRLQRCCKEEG